MSESLKVLVLAQYFSPDMGGGSTRASIVVKGLFSKGCEVTVVAAFPHYPHGKVPREYRHKAVVSERFGGARVFRVWIPSLPHSSPLKRIVLHFCFCVSSLFALPFVGKVDVVWGANPNLFSFFPSFIYGATKRVPIVRNVDDLWPEAFYDMGLVKSRVLKMLLDFVAKLSYTIPVAITPISSAYKRRIVEKYGVGAGKIFVIEVGADVASLPSLNVTKKDDFVVMYSGVLGVGYDFRCVLDVARLLSDHSRIMFVVRGIGECEHELRELIAKLGLENVVLDTNYVSKSRLVAILSSADVFLLPMSERKTVEEGLPTKLFEYQAFGKPVVCCSDGEPARYVRSTASGLVVKLGDAKALANAIWRLYNDENLAKALGANGREYIYQNLTCEKIGERMYNVFSSITK
jgi:glycosyltransferase involved in cell wall biosynthesis